MIKSMVFRGCARAPATTAANSGSGRSQPLAVARNRARLALEGMAMAQRGRKSTASRETVELTPMLPGHGRPEPPPGLSPDEARAWRDVVDSAPGFWLDPAALLILRRLVTQAAIAERKERRMRRLLLLRTVQPPTRISRSSRARMPRPQKESPIS